MFQFEGAVALVTGAAFGIGRATAVELARHGARIVVVDIFDDEGQATVNEIAGLGGEAIYLHADVASRSEIEACVTAAIDWEGHCDLLVSNAAISGVGAPHEFSAQDWERMLGVNLFASIWASRALLPHMLERDHGHLCFVSSGWGFQGAADNAPYSVSKFGLVGLAESLALYLKDTHVSVSLVVPGAIGGRHADTFIVAGGDDGSSDLVVALKAERVAKTSQWPPPEGMAKTIVDGIAAGSYYIIQEGPGHEGWLQQLWSDRASDAEAFLR